MSILKVWQLTLILVKNDPGGEVIQRKRLFYILLMRKHDFWPFQWLLNGQKWGGFKKASLYVHYKGLTTDSYFGKTGPPWGEVIQKKRLFTLFWWENMISDLSIDFQMVKNWGLKKLLSMSILKVWQLTLILAKQDSLGRGHIEKKLFYTLLMRKHDFWPFHWFSNGQKWGVKKASLYVYFEGLTTDSYFGKTRPHGERLYRKKGFFTLFWSENMISDLSVDVQMVKNEGV